MSTIVTGLFDITREKMDGRNWSDYLKWFEQTLSLNSPMVIFVENKLKNFVLEKRKDKKTKIICQNLNKLEYYKYKEKMDEVLASPEYQTKIKDPNRIECKYSEYSIIQYSKFSWMKHAAKNNYFDDSYFIWMDAGLSRFFGPLDTSRPYPSENIENILKSQSNKIMIQTFISFYPDLFYANTLSKDYLLDNRSYVMGGMFSGDQAAIYNLYDLVKKTFKEMLKDNIVNNEQIVLGYLFKQNPELFLHFKNDASKHRNYELINEYQR